MLVASAASLSGGQALRKPKLVPALEGTARLKHRSLEIGRMTPWTSCLSSVSVRANVFSSIWETGWPNIFGTKLGASIGL